MPISKANLKKSLIDNLEARGLVEPYYIDQVENYCSLQDKRKQLDAQIAKQGVAVFDEKKGYYVDNPLIKSRVQVSQQMASIATLLGLKEIAAKAKAGAVEDYEL